MKDLYTPILSPLVLLLTLSLFAVIAGAHPTQESSGESPLLSCGNGVLEGLEECDTGNALSDTQPDRCRSDCRNAYCGDGVVDTGEYCDNGPGNSDLIPGACRTSCRLPYCGDGVIDITAGEECDDALEPDSCFQCARCTKPTQDLQITESTRLCSGVWNIRDQGNPGVINVSGEGIALDCTGASFNVTGSNTGTAIVVSGSGVIIRNCNLKGYQTAIKLNGHHAVLVGNDLCGNFRHVEATHPDNHGINNTCQRVNNWADMGAERCTNGCPLRSPPQQATTERLTGGGAARSDLTPVIPSRSPQRAATGRVIGKGPAQAERKPRLVKPATRQPGFASLYATAAKAHWQNSTSRIQFGSDRTPRNGYAMTRARGKLASGLNVRELLVTQPDARSNSYIQGTFPALTIKAKQRFLSTVGLMQGARSSDNARFEVLIKDGKRITSLIKRTVRGNRHAKLDADLSKWRNRRVQIILKVSSPSGKALTTAAAWVKPNLR